MFKEKMKKQPRVEGWQLDELEKFRLKKETANHPAFFCGLVLSKKMSEEIDLESVFMTGQPTPPLTHPPKALLRAY